MEKKRTTRKLKTNTNMDQEPYPNQEDGCIKGLDGSRYQLMDVLGGEVEEDPCRMLKMSGDAAKIEKEMKLAFRNGGFVKMKSRIGAMV
ncbi:hypothetical protein DEO72_LG1g2372 [Vigna unguiculata]|uniref:Uncharacterized protein n=1 Tax=Vigna unguiculata TaxID=3917 RepID=A0A4D6KL33_VIGUN|nr:hypothetical protein DEO72_LG1g2372 [Vigna unguiculata]